MAVSLGDYIYGGTVSGGVQAGDNDAPAPPPAPTTATLLAGALAPPPTPPPVARSTPPDGFTWVDTTPDVPGHWERLRKGQTIGQGAPLSSGPPGWDGTTTVSVDDHTQVSPEQRAQDQAKAIAALKIDTYLFEVASSLDYNSYAGVFAKFPGIDPAVPNWAWNHAQNVDGVPGTRTTGGKVYLADNDALKAHDAGQPALEYWARAWDAAYHQGVQDVDDKAAADAAAKAAKAAADAAAKAAADAAAKAKAGLGTGLTLKPPVVAPPQTNTKLLVGIAVAGAGLYLLY